MLLRSINTTLASALPVASLLLVGAGLFGQVTLREFAIALLVGMLTGAYSSIFVAAPLLGWLKGRSAAFAGDATGHLVGEDLRAVVVAGPGGVRAGPAAAGDAGPLRRPAPDDRSGRRAATVVSAPPERLLTHPPRPRKKKKRWSILGT